MLGSRVSSGAPSLETRRLSMMVARRGDTEVVEGVEEDDCCIVAVREVCHGVECRGRMAWAIIKYSKEVLPAPDG